MSTEDDIERLRSSDRMCSVVGETLCETRYMVPAYRGGL
jgi:hypothetical protein